MFSLSLSSTARPIWISTISNIGSMEMQRQNKGRKKKLVQYSMRFILHGALAAEGASMSSSDGQETKSQPSHTHTPDSSSLISGCTTSLCYTWPPLQLPLIKTGRRIVIRNVGTNYTVTYIQS